MARSDDHSAVSGAKRRVSSASRAVRPRDDLEQMPARIFEIDSPATVVAVDLSGLLLKRIGPVRQVALPYTAKDLVEFGFADEKGVVPGGDILHLVEIQGGVIDMHGKERAEWHSRR